MISQMGDTVRAPVLVCEIDYTHVKRIPSRIIDASWSNDLALVSFGLERLVESFLAARFRFGDVVVFPLKASALLFLGDDFFQDGLFAIFLVQAAAVEFGRPLNNSTNLRESWHIVF